MDRPQVISNLNRLLAIEYRSLPMYLADAAPWTHRGDEKSVAALESMVADQKAMAQRLAELVLDLEGLVDPGEFPMEYTDTHFLSLDYLLTEIIKDQRHTIAEIERVIPRLSQHRAARELAEEVLGSERAHLEALEAQVDKQPA